jgi:hypothetical protein
MSKFDYIKFRQYCLECLNVAISEFLNPVLSKCGYNFFKKQKKSSKSGDFGTFFSQKSFAWVALGFFMLLPSGKI